MHFSFLVTALTAILGANALPTPEESYATKFQPASTFSTDLLAAQALVSKGVYSFKNGWSDSSQCSATNVAVRREWQEPLAIDLKERYANATQVFPFTAGAEGLH